MELYWPVELGLAIFFVVSWDFIPSAQGYYRDTKVFKRRQPSCRHTVLTLPNRLPGVLVLCHLRV